MPYEQKPTKQQAIDAYAKLRYLPAAQGEIRCISCGECYPEGEFAPDPLKPTHRCVCVACQRLGATDIALRARQTAVREYNIYRKGKGRRASLTPEAAHAAMLRGERTCSSCWMRPTNFTRSNRRPDGLQSECPTCQKLRRQLRGKPGEWHRIRDILRESVSSRDVMKAYSLFRRDLADKFGPA